jgi:hypothetical protein
MAMADAVADALNEHEVQGLFAGLLDGSNFGDDVDPAVSNDTSVEGLEPVFPVDLQFVEVAGNVLLPGGTGSFESADDGSVVLQTLQQIASDRPKRLWRHGLMYPSPTVNPHVWWRATGDGWNRRRQECEYRQKGT